MKYETMILKTKTNQIKQFKKEQHIINIIKAEKDKDKRIVSDNKGNMHYVYWNGKTDQLVIKLVGNTYYIEFRFAKSGAQIGKITLKPVKQDGEVILILSFEGLSYEFEAFYTTAMSEQIKEYLETGIDPKSYVLSQKRTDMNRRLYEKCVFNIWLSITIIATIALIPFFVFKTNKMLEASVIVFMLAIISGVLLVNSLKKDWSKRGII